MLPSNVLRPIEASWQRAWGDSPTPPAYEGRSLEIGQLLELTGLGACILALPPGARGAPLHHHHVEEELFFVLEGELTVRELAPGADRYTEYILRAGEVVAYPPGTGLAHQSENRGASEVRYLALSDAWATGEVAVYPDSGKVLIRALGAIGVLSDGTDVDAHIAAARAAAEARPSHTVARSDRPAHVQGPDRVAERDLGGGVFGRPLARVAGATKVFANLDRLAPGAVSGPLHWHTADDELLLVLRGAPTLRQLRDGVEEQALLRPGDVVSWKAGEAVGHQLRVDGREDAEVLVVGTSRREDVTVFPEETRVFVRALGRGGVLERAGYWSGER